jgi:hypothetical protein
VDRRALAGVDHFGKVERACLQAFSCPGHQPSRAKYFVFAQTTAPDLPDVESCPPLPSMPCPVRPTLWPRAAYYVLYDECLAFALFAILSQISQPYIAIPVRRANFSMFRLCPGLSEGSLSKLCPLRRAGQALLPGSPPAILVRLAVPESSTNRNAT